MSPTACFRCAPLCVPAVLAVLLKLVSRKRETTAVQLHEESRSFDTVGATAWNNRLASLAAKSLVVEILQGRTKKYRPVLEVA